MDTREFRESGHRIVDYLADYLGRVEEEPLLRPSDPGELRRLFDEPIPPGESSIESVLLELNEKLLPYCTQVNHPGYFGLITPSPLPVGILGDFIASALNQNLGVYSIGPSAVALERRTVRWLADLAAYGPGAGGNLTSGGMMANLIGLKLARDWASRDTAQHEGMPERYAAYTSEERHVAIDKSADIVGIGRDSLRILPTDARFEIRLDALEAALEEDRRQGIRPMAIIAMGGSTNTGAVDPLPELRTIADRVGAWLHVDAAYGGGMLLSRRRDEVLRGLELADSLAIDPHKWFYAPLDAGAILVKDESRLTRSFGMQPAYLADPLGADPDRHDYYLHGLEQSRRFRGLKVWMGFKRYGTKKMGGWIDANVDQAMRLYELASGHPDFEPAVRPRMSAFCVRYLPAGEDETARRLHAEVARRIEQGGRFWISTTHLKGRTWFRINPVNFRTRLEHMDELFDLLVAECTSARARS